MFADLLMVGVSLLLLFVGAELLVRGSASLARRAGLSALLVGLTIVAFGTSSPELVVSVKAALSGQGDISVGNVVGSNSFNIGVILGLVALVCPIPVHAQVIKVDAPIALGVAIVLPLLLMDHELGRAEGVLLVAALIAYAWMNITLSRRSARSEGAPLATVAGVTPSTAPSSGEASVDAAVPGVSRSWALDIARIVAGLVLLVLGSRLLVDHSVSLARALEISEAVIGLTIVAAGTSMPELATSMVAAVRSQPDIAVGNIIGSNVFNILGILGVASMVSPLHAPGITTLDLVAMIGFTVLLLPMLHTGRILRRLEGGVLLALYAAYLFMLVPP